MSAIRKFFLEAVCLVGAVIGIEVAIGGYLANLPSPPERVAVAAVWADLNTPSSIPPKASAGCAASVAASTDRQAPAPEADDAVSKTAWTDPPLHRASR